MNVDQYSLKQLLTSLQPIIEQKLYDERVVGASIGVVQNQTLVWTFDYGYARWHSGLPPTPNTLFRIDSNTKTFTGTAIMQLRDEGKLDLSDPITTYVPEFEQVTIGREYIKDVTLRRLLTHRAGLNGEAVGAWGETGIGPTSNEMLKGLKSCGVVIPPDSRHKYSNLGFILLGQVISRISGMPYSEYIATQIFRVLGMSSSTYNPDESTLAKAIHYHRPMVEEIPVKAHRLTHNARRPGGGIYSTVTDLAKWLSQQFRTGLMNRGSNQVLSGKSLEEMHQPLLVEPDWNSGQCLVWRAIRSGDKIHLGHGGGNAGSASQTYFNKNGAIGVVILTNTSEQSTHHEVAKLILDTACAALDTRSVQPAQVTTSSMPPTLVQFIGRYEAKAPNSAFRIAWADGSLILLDADSKLTRHLQPAIGATTPTRLDHTDDPTVFITGEGRLAGETITFTQNSPQEPATKFTLQTGSVFHKVSPR